MDQVTLKVGSRDLVVDTTPLASPPSNFRVQKLVHANDRTLVLKPSFGCLFAPLFVILGGVPLAMVIVFLILHRGKMEYEMLAGFVLPVIAGCFVILLSSRRQTFNLDTGHMTDRALWFVHRRPLSEILAVQVINGGRHTFQSKKGTQVTYSTYQLNLILDDEQRPRLNLTNHNDWDWTYKNGQELAGFLSVPFMEHVSKEEPKPTGSDGQNAT